MGIKVSRFRYGSCFFVCLYIIVLDIFSWKVSYVLENFRYDSGKVNRNFGVYIES